MAPNAPKPVAIIASGRRRPSGDATARWEKGKRWGAHMHNLWEMLDDPIDGNQCDKDKDYKEAKTLLAVYSQE